MLECMRWFVFCAAVIACAQTVPQGNTLHVIASADGASARLDGRTIKLFPQKEGGVLGLMPIPVLEKPGAYDLDILDKNGKAVQTSTIAVLDAHFPTQNVVISKSLSELKASPDEAEITGAFRKQVSDVRYWAEPLVKPVPGCMTSLFGVQRLHNGKPTGDFHGGLDLRAAAGTPIHATAAGVVKIARQFNLHGGTVAIDHGQGFESMYLHMSKIAAVEGATVQQGDVIGFAGSTGRSTAPHLHWTLYVNGVPVNPLQWVKVTACAPAPKSNVHHGSSVRHP